MQTIKETEALQILADVIKIPSVNDHELAVAKYLQALLRRYGITAELNTVTGDRANLVAEIGNGQPVLVVSGHMDVVAAGDRDAWDTDPFTLTEKSGQLFGRGVTDMKAGLVALIVAMINLQQQGLPKQGTIRLLATMGEEVGEAGSAAFYQQGLMQDAAGLLIAEPSTVYGTAAEQKGSYDVKLTSKGKAVHSSTPERGYNALVPLIQLLNEANDYFATLPAGEMGPVKFNIDVLNGGDQVNSLPDSATALINVRTIPEYDNDQVIAKLNQLIATYNQQGAKISATVIMNEAPIATKIDNRLVKLIQKVGQPYAGREIVVAPSPGITDASNLAQQQPVDFAFAVYGPGNMTQHQVNESLPKQMFYDFIDIYQQLFTDFLAN
ncbi:ArgE/DapE family deacylase [Lactiplantibacillus paraplantarum]|uniref:ArgE/DapE family deacylase n=1 Tax=Lactiplantibacillus paraplantarum TaxID=60520 RepID=UPI0005140431|nr:ArgE/DapE family deacylase [Lactiplantibacillus paraplantarum]OAX76597.1 succinyl-diaminopimelate desuccinylase [Lactiplantibacillus plantarum]ALO04375.1 succinyl-diaminopimelate desuccinylase [Lactiplantibacillus paraplantarum]KGE75263.1 succinyl-diaminopimelate desuccinylase [Lactiplantibacillus paraplantarum]MCW1910410.1 ArgE/DapE family deacylase [Lactiplantibacillus paraplantarum]RDG13257.1 succinyl-diaminopimelate desuccinylase [Lactiplantibacillus paraplantarum]